MSCWVWRQRPWVINCSGSSPTAEGRVRGVERTAERGGMRRPMLSLDKTKEVGRAAGVAGDVRKRLLSWKLDGLTDRSDVRRTARLQKAVTRGNGEVGEVITSTMRQDL